VWSPIGVEAAADQTANAAPLLNHQRIAMLFRKSSSSPHDLADSAMQSIEHGMSSTQRAADHALDKVAATAQDLRGQVSPLFERASERARDLAQRSADTVRDRSLQVRDKARRAGDSTVTYIRGEPVKSVLVAAAAGAIAVALLSWLRRSE
jgi:ElaB/YqjD/DUF883 family membrane-anchored ribosome-binding protein